MDGLAVGTTCYRSSVEAGAAACSAITGVSSAGVVTCSAPSISGGVLSYTLNVESGSGTVSRAATQQLQPCDPADLEEWAPAIGAWFLALVAILCARMLYTRVFQRESS